MSSVKELVDHIIADGVMTREEHESLMDQMHADGQIDEDESEQISRIFSLIQQGSLVVVDDERERAEMVRRKELEDRMASLSSDENDIVSSEEEDE